MGNLREHQYTFLIISRPFLLRMRYVSDKGCREYQKTHTLCYRFFPDNRATYEIIWKNIVEPERPQMTIWRMRIACWIPKATDIHTEYAILIAFPTQQWLHERASLLRYTYISSLIFFFQKFSCFLFYFRYLLVFEVHSPS